MSEVISITLYSTVGCHLCDQVILMLDYVKVQSKATGIVFTVREVDIAESDELIAELGDKIPVLEAGVTSENNRLNWPFEFSELYEWVKSIKKER